MVRGGTSFGLRVSEGPPVQPLGGPAQRGARFHSYGAPVPVSADIRHQPRARGKYAHGSYLAAPHIRPAYQRLTQAVEDGLQAQRHFGALLARGATFARRGNRDALDDPGSMRSFASMQERLFLHEQVTRLQDHLAWESLCLSSHQAPPRNSLENIALAASVGVVKPLPEYRRPLSGPAAVAHIVSTVRNRCLKGVTLQGEERASLVDLIKLVAGGQLPLGQVEVAEGVPSLPADTEAFVSRMADRAAGSLAGALQVSQISDALYGLLHASEYEVVRQVRVADKRVVRAAVKYARLRDLCCRADLLQVDFGCVVTDYGVLVDLEGTLCILTTELTGALVESLEGEAWGWLAACVAGDELLGNGTLTALWDFRSFIWERIALCGNTAYDGVKALDALVMVAMSLHGGGIVDREFVDGVLEGLRTAWGLPPDYDLEHTGPVGTVLQLPLPQAADILQLSHSFGCCEGDEAWGWPQQVEASSTIVLTDDAACRRSSGVLIRWIFEGYVRKHRRWPPLRAPEEPLYDRWRATLQAHDPSTGLCPDSADYRMTREAWASVDMPGAFTFEVSNSLSTKLDDKSLAPEHEKWEAIKADGFLRGNPRLSPEEKRLIMAWLKGDHTPESLSAYRHAFHVADPDFLSSLTGKLTQKEFELKVKIRFFASFPVYFRHILCENRDNLKKVAELVPGQLTVAGEKDKAAVLDSIPKLLASEAGFIKLLFTMDFTRWNVVFQELKMLHTNRFYDTAFNTGAYSAETAALRSVRYMCQLFGRLETLETPQAGAEGINQLKWSLLTLSDVMSAIMDIGFDGTAAGSGDNVVAIVKVPVGLIQDTYDGSLGAAAADIKVRLVAALKQYGHTCKAEETMVSDNAAVLLKNYRIGSAQLPKYLKQFYAVRPRATGGFPAAKLAVANVVGAVAETAKRSPHVVPAYVTGLPISLVALQRHIADDSAAGFPGLGPQGLAAVFLASSTFGFVPYPNLRDIMHRGFHDSLTRTVGVMQRALDRRPDLGQYLDRLVLRPLELIPKRSSLAANPTSLPHLGPRSAEAVAKAALLHQMSSIATTEEARLYLIGAHPQAQEWLEAVLQGVSPLDPRMLALLYAGSPTAVAQKVVAKVETDGTLKQLLGRQGYPKGARDHATLEHAELRHVVELVRLGPHADACQGGAFSLLRVDQSLSTWPALPAVEVARRLRKCAYPDIRDTITRPDPFDTMTTSLLHCETGILEMDDAFMVRYDGPLAQYYPGADLQCYLSGGRSYISSHTASKIVSLRGNPEFLIVPAQAMMALSEACAWAGEGASSAKAAAEAIYSVYGLTFPFSSFAALSSRTTGSQYHRMKAGTLEMTTHVQCPPDRVSHMNVDISQLPSLKYGGNNVDADVLGHKNAAICIFAVDGYLLVAASGQPCNRHPVMRVDLDMGQYSRIGLFPYDPWRSPDGPPKPPDILVSRLQRADRRELERTLGAALERRAAEHLALAAEAETEEETVVAAGGLLEETVEGVQREMLALQAYSLAVAGLKERAHAGQRPTETATLAQLRILLSEAHLPELSGTPRNITDIHTTRADDILLLAVEQTVAGLYVNKAFMLRTPSHVAALLSDAALRASPLYACAYSMHQAAAGDRLLAAVAGLTGIAAPMEARLSPQGCADFCSRALTAVILEALQTTPLVLFRTLPRHTPSESVGLLIRARAQHFAAARRELHTSCTELLRLARTHARVTDALESVLWRLVERGVEAQEVVGSLGLHMCLRPATGEHDELIDVIDVPRTLRTAANDYLTAYEEGSARARRAGQEPTARDRMAGLIGRQLLARAPRAAGEGLELEQGRLTDRQNILLYAAAGAAAAGRERELAGDIAELMTQRATLLAEKYQIRLLDVDVKDVRERLKAVRRLSGDEATLVRSYGPTWGRLMINALAVTRLTTPMPALLFPGARDPCPSAFRAPSQTPCPVDLRCVTRPGERAAATQWLQVSLQGPSTRYHEGLAELSRVAARNGPLPALVLRGRLLRADRGYRATETTAAHAFGKAEDLAGLLRGGEETRAQGSKAVGVLEPLLAALAARRLSRRLGIHCAGDGRCGFARSLAAVMPQAVVCASTLGNVEERVEYIGPEPSTSDDGQPRSGPWRIGSMVTRMDCTSAASHRVAAQCLRRLGADLDVVICDAEPRGDTAAAFTTGAAGALAAGTLAAAYHELTDGGVVCAKCSLLPTTDLTAVCVLACCAYSYVCLRRPLECHRSLTEVYICASHPVAPDVETASAAVQMLGSISQGRVGVQMMAALASVMPANELARLQTALASEIEAAAELRRWGAGRAHRARIAGLSTRRLYASAVLPVSDGLSQLAGDLTHELGTYVKVDCARLGGGAGVRAGDALLRQGEDLLHQVAIAARSGAARGAAAAGARGRILRAGAEARAPRAGHQVWQGLHAMAVREGPAAASLAAVHAGLLLPQDACRSATYGATCILIGALCSSYEACLSTGAAPSATATEVAGAIYQLERAWVTSGLAGSEVELVATGDGSLDQPQTIEIVYRGAYRVSVDVRRRLPVIAQRMAATVHSWRSRLPTEADEEHGLGMLYHLGDLLPSTRRPGVGQMRYRDTAAMLGALAGMW